MPSMMGTRLEGVASLPSRALGAFVDAVVMSPIIVAVTYLVRPLWLAGVIVAAVGFVYQIPQIAIWGMTPGARAAGVMVAASDRQPPGWGRATARWVTIGVISTGLRVVTAGRAVGLGTGLVVIAVVYAPALVDSRRRALTDRVAGTIVLDRAPGNRPRPLPSSPDDDPVTAQQVRALAVIIVVILLLACSRAGWMSVTSQADRQAREQAVALEASLKGTTPLQLIFGPSRTFDPKVNLVSMSGSATHVVIQAQPRGVLHLRCVVANLDASGRFDVVIRHSGCHGG